VLNEVQLLSKLLQAVPPATYAASGVAVSWTKVSESHSVPVVFPEALNDQLQILVNDQYLRSMCNHLLSFSPSALRHALATQRPTPMYPEAPTTAVRLPYWSLFDRSANNVVFLRLLGAIRLWGHCVGIVTVNVTICNLAEDEVDREGDVGQESV
jgi:hypothetical protein